MGNTFDNIGIMRPHSSFSASLSFKTLTPDRSIDCGTGIYKNIRQSIQSAREARQSISPLKCCPLPEESSRQIVAMYSSSMSRAIV